jgi:hypothetical protein
MCNKYIDNTKFQIIVAYYFFINVNKKKKIEKYIYVDVLWNIFYHARTIGVMNYVISPK